MHWGVVGTVGVSAIVAITAALFGWLTALRAQYDRVLNVLDHISSDQVAQARHRLGLIIFDQGGRVPHEQRQEAVEDLFVVLWAMRRIAAVRTSLPWFTRAIDAPWSGPHILLKESTKDWVGFWMENYPNIAAETRSDTAGSDGGLIELAEAWKTSRPEREQQPDPGASRAQAAGHG